LFLCAVVKRSATALIAARVIACMNERIGYENVLPPSVLCD